MNGEKSRKGYSFNAGSRFLPDRFSGSRVKDSEPQGRPVQVQLSSTYFTAVHGSIARSACEPGDAAGLAEPTILGIDRLDVSFPVALGGLKDNQVLVVEIPQDVQGDVPTGSFKVAFDSRLGFQGAEIEGLDPHPDIRVRIPDRQGGDVIQTGFIRLSQSQARPLPKDLQDLFGIVVLEVDNLRLQGAADASVQLGVELRIVAQKQGHVVVLGPAEKIENILIAVLLGHQVGFVEDEDLFTGIARAEVRPEFVQGVAPGPDLEDLREDLETGIMVAAIDIMKSGSAVDGLQRFDQRLDQESLSAPPGPDNEQMIGDAGFGVPQDGVRYGFDLFPDQGFVRNVIEIEDPVVLDSPAAGVQPVRLLSDVFADVHDTRQLHWAYQRSRGYKDFGSCVVQYDGDFSRTWARSV